MVQIYTGRTARTLKPSAIVAYTMRWVVLIVIKDFKKFSIDYGDTFVAFLPGFCALKDSDEDNSVEQGPGGS